jgi:hypothetical protein
MTSLEYYTTLTSTRRRCYFVVCWTWFSARLIVRRSSGIEAKGLIEVGEDMGEVTLLHEMGSMTSARPLSLVCRKPG